MDYRIESILLIIICSHLEIITFSVSEDDLYHDYCIIGAGPGGLQLAYHMQVERRNYIVFERNNISGSFFLKYPRHRKLISINKRYTGEKNTKFNMRHDWNSLISDDPSLKFKHYTDEFYPQADVMLKYLEDFTREHKLNVKYNTEVYKVRKVTIDGAEKEIQNFVFKLNEKETNMEHICRTVILATGLGTPYIPDIDGKEHTVSYEDVSTNPKDFTGKNVLILGRGNSAFETADAIYGETNLVHMIGRSRVKLAWSTHYVGDLRAINNVLLDNYQLKSLDGVVEGPMHALDLAKDPDGKISLNLSNMFKEQCRSTGQLFPDNFSMRRKYDCVIQCLGFTSDMSLFDEPTRPVRCRHDKYPVLKSSYESVNVPGLYVVGTLSHLVDHKKSAGGFVHGFRYTAHVVHKILEAKFHGKVWQHREYTISHLINALVKRTNEADELYQMYGTLGDVITIDKETNIARYYEEFPIQSLDNFYALTGAEAKESNVFLVMDFEYGQNFSGPDKDTFKSDRAVGSPELAHLSNFLHPVFYFYQKLPTVADMLSKNKKASLPRPDFIHHIVEDFLTDFTAPVMHLTPLRRFLEHIVQQDLRNFDNEFCTQQFLTSKDVPFKCKDALNHGININLKMSPVEKLS